MTSCAIEAGATFGAGVAADKIGGHKVAPFLKGTAVGLAQGISDTVQSSSPSDLPASFQEGLNTFKDAFEPSGPDIGRETKPYEEDY